MADVTITTKDGTVLSATNDLELAWKWAEHNEGTHWAGMSYGDRAEASSPLLRQLRSGAAHG
jgi:hypothetical protein